MNRSAKWGLIVAVTLILLFALSWLIDQCPAGDDNAVRFGILTILPPLVAIALAFITKETILSLFLGVFVGEYMVCADGLKPGYLFHGRSMECGYCSPMSAYWRCNPIGNKDGWCKGIGGCIIQICEYS